LCSKEREENKKKNSLCNSNFSEQARSTTEQELTRPHAPLRFVGEERETERVATGPEHNGHRASTRGAPGDEVRTRRHQTPCPPTCWGS